MLLHAAAHRWQCLACSQLIWPCTRRAVQQDAPAASKQQWSAALPLSLLLATQAVLWRSCGQLQLPAGGRWRLPRLLKRRQPQRQLNCCARWSACSRSWLRRTWRWPGWESSLRCAPCTPCSPALLQVQVTSTASCVGNPMRKLAGAMAVASRQTDLCQCASCYQNSARIQIALVRRRTIQNGTTLQAAEERVAAAGADVSDWQQALNEAEVRVHAAQQELHERQAERAEVHVQLQQMAAEVGGPAESDLLQRRAQ